MPIPVSARFENDTQGAVQLLWHRPMEGGLIVAQEVATVLPGRSRIMRTFANHGFSAYSGDEELQHWTMGTQRRQRYKVSSAKVVPPPFLQKAPTAAQSNDGCGKPQRTGKETTAAGDAEGILRQARSLASGGKHKEALALFKKAGADLDLGTRPKLRQRIEFLERLVSAHYGRAEREKDDASPSAGISGGDVATSSSANSGRCAICTLPKPCGKVHRPSGATKRSYADVVRSGPEPPVLPKRRPSEAARRVGGHESWKRQRLTTEQLERMLARAKSVSADAKLAANRARAISATARWRRPTSDANFLATLGRTGDAMRTQSPDQFSPEKETLNRSTTRPNVSRVGLPTRYAPPKSSYEGGSPYYRVPYRTTQYSSAWNESCDQAASKVKSH